MLTAIIPVFRVANLAEALAFSCGRLGFEREFAHGEACAGVRCDGVRIHLSTHSGDGNPGSNVRVAIDDVTAWFEERRRRGCFPPADAATLARDPVRHQPTDQTWGTREIYVEDPDGNRLCYFTPLSG